ncbi:MAG: DUF4190 domain-containing protein [Kiritimatiellae bacterium]|nr:DUF4190 domain-containing protein [Kiritimatiellia bacterium]
MPCKNHPNAEAVARCAGCQESFCNNCLVELRGRKYCQYCKVMAIGGVQVLADSTSPCDEAKKALWYAILGPFCFVCAIMAIAAALKARREIKGNPRLTGSGKATAALIIAIGWLAVTLFIPILAQAIRGGP